MENIFVPPYINQYTPQEEYVEYGYPHSNALVKHVLSYDVASGSEITPCIKIDIQIFGKRYEMTHLTSHIWQNPNVFHAKDMISKQF